MKSLILTIVAILCIWLAESGKLKHTVIEAFFYTCAIAIFASVILRLLF